MSGKSFERALLWQLKWSSLASSTPLLRNVFLQKTKDSETVLQESHPIDDHGLPDRGDQYLGPRGHAAARAYWAGERLH